MQFNSVHACFGCFKLFQPITANLAVRHLLQSISAVEAQLPLSPVLDHFLIRLAYISRALYLAVLTRPFHFTLLYIII